jgi:hypothetical protein
MLKLTQTYRWHKHPDDYVWGEPQRRQADHCFSNKSRSDQGSLQSNRGDIHAVHFFSAASASKSHEIVAASVRHRTHISTEEPEVVTDADGGTTIALHESMNR